MSVLDDIAARSDIHLKVNTASLDKVAMSTIDGLYQIPLLALAMLIVLKGQRRGLRVADVSTWTLATLAHNSLRFGRRDESLQWSALLRRRCADALVFLEDVSLVQVNEAPERMVAISPTGRDAIRKYSSGVDDAAVLVRDLERARRNVELRGFTLL